MDLIVNQVVQLQVIHVPHCDRIVKIFAGTAVLQCNFTILTDVCHAEALADILLMRAVKNRRHDFPAERPGGHAEMDLEHLADIHT